MKEALLKVGVLWVSFCAATGCSGIQHRMPEIDATDELASLTEIKAYPVPLQDHDRSEFAARQMLENVYEKVKPAAQDICRYVDEATACAWNVSYTNTLEYQAFALSGNRIVIGHEIMDTSDTEDEVAFVLAHEMGHHIADHHIDNMKQKTAGMLIAGLAVAALTQNTGGCFSYSCQRGLQNAAATTMNLGANIVAHAFSKAQEKEADYLAAYIVNRAGYDLELSRAAVVKLGVMNDDRITSFTDTHPAGPQRLANYDKFIELILEDKDGFPGNRPVKKDTIPISSNSPAVNSEPKNSRSNFNKADPKTCRFYLPTGNLCIH